MNIEWKDFNGAGDIFSEYWKEWEQLNKVLGEMPLCLKGSRQEGKNGVLNFDPVGINAHIKEKLGQIDGWVSNPKIPSEFSFLGKDVDFVVKGILIEAQFSNYPFLLNNVLRSELFYKNKTELNGSKVKALVIISRGWMFNAHSSNSTLYYEQGCDQLEGLDRFKVIGIPIRMVSLKSPIGEDFSAQLIVYTNSQSRTITHKDRISIRIDPSGRKNAPPQLKKLEV